MGGSVEGARAMTDARSAALSAFLNDAGWGAATVVPLAGDASTRRYLRAVRDGEHAVVMDAPPKAEAAACPPDADEATRRALGYNALARLAGPDLNAFVAVGDHLSALGLSAPRILAADAAHGFALLEDLGDTLFGPTLAAGAGDEAAYYGVAVDALLRLHQTPAPSSLPARGGERTLLAYDAVAMRAETDLLLDWFYPYATGGEAADAVRAGFDAIWAPLFDIAAGEAVLVLRDYHADNLIWLPEREGAARVGLLDFQDAVVGSPAYDLASLLEDIRRDVDRDLAADLLARYCAEAAMRPGFDADAFRAACAILAAQRNAKILGIFVRLAKRDGKARYLDYLPRVWARFTDELSHPALAPLKRWTDDHLTASVEKVLSGASA